MIIMEQHDQEDIGLAEARARLEYALSEMRPDETRITEEHKEVVERIERLIEATLNMRQ